MLQVCTSISSLSSVVSPDVKAYSSTQNRRGKLELPWGIIGNVADATRPRCKHSCFLRHARYLVCLGGSAKKGLNQQQDQQQLRNFNLHATILSACVPSEFYFDMQVKPVCHKWSSQDARWCKVAYGMHVRPERSAAVK